MATQGTASSGLGLLEHRYIDLLERRIKDLEAVIASGSIPGVATPVTTTVSDNDKQAKYDEKAAEKKKEEPKAPEVQDSNTQTGKEEQDPTEEDRHRIVLNVLDSETGEYVDKPPAVATAKNPKASAKKPGRAFTFRKFLRTIYRSGEETTKSTGSEVDIESEALQRLLEKVTQKVSGVDKIDQMDSPFQSLVWSWSAAESEAGKTNPGDSEEVKQARADLRALMDVISTSSGDESLDRYFKNKRSMDESRTVTFETLWTIFPRGSYIVARPFLNEPQVFMVQEVCLPDMDDSQPEFSVIAYSYDWDGAFFNRVPYSFPVKSFSDRKGIFELPFYPLKDFRSTGQGGASDIKDVEALKEQLIERGRKCREYCLAVKGKQTFRYDGIAYHHKSGGLFRSNSPYDDDDDDSFSSWGGSNYGRPEKSEVSHDSTSYLKGVVVVVDFQSYFEYQSYKAPLLGDLKPYVGGTECSCTECRQLFEKVYRYSWDRWPKRDELSRDQLMMLPPRVLGYCLSQKKWVQLQVKRLKKPSPKDRSNFDKKLILNQHHKDLISKSVGAHGKVNVVDYIPDKGKGLVILLWGVPGVGKTLTAESVAALAGKPLFSIGVSDIGIESTRVEKNLQKVFALAGLWEAVLLFDEADVFLEARDARGSDMQRNTMVSVLLRILEYFDGILILTTNRLKTFDIAVQSRIHIAIEYGDLNNEQREKIFIEFLSQLDGQKLVEDLDSCKEWIHEEGREKQLNGRQIRNIVSTAMGLAHADDRKLRRSDLSKVALNTSHFKKALAEQEAIYKNRQIQGQYP